MAKTFGPTITSLIYDNVEPDRVLLWDSKARGGRPDTMKILKEVYMKWEAEGQSAIHYCGTSTYAIPQLYSSLPTMRVIKK
jgi:hypothetical protein